MKEDAGMLLPPTLDCFRLVATHIIQYHMNVCVPVLLNDTIEKAKKVFGAMSILACRLYSGISYIQRSKQLRRIVSLVIMSTSRYPVWAHRQLRLCSIYCL